MNTGFLLMAQYNGSAVIPVEKVCKDYFPHLCQDVFLRKCARGEIRLPLVRIDSSNKTARGVHVSDLATYIDTRAEAARKELQQISGAT